MSERFISRPTTHNYIASRWVERTEWLEKTPQHCLLLARCYGDGYNYCFGEDQPRPSESSPRKRQSAGKLTLQLTSRRPLHEISTMGRLNSPPRSNTMRPDVKGRLQGQWYFSSLTRSPEIAPQRRGGLIWNSATANFSPQTPPVNPSQGATTTLSKTQRR